MNETAQPPEGNGGFDGDKVAGILLIIFSGVGTCCGLMFAFAAEFIARFLSQAFADQAGAKGGPHPGDFSTPGNIAAGIGGLIAAAMIVNIIGAVGVMRSARWGFYVCLVVGGINTLLTLASLRGIGLIGLALGVGQLIYCCMRLFGNLGPRPA